jgi:hypothetical protein
VRHSRRPYFEDRLKENEAYPCVVTRLKVISTNISIKSGSLNNELALFREADNYRVARKHGECQSNSTQ